MTVPVAERGPQVLAVYGLFTALTTLALLLRAYSRIAIARAFGWDDGLAIVAWVSRTANQRRDVPHRVVLEGHRILIYLAKVFFICYAAFAIAGVHHGTGQHAWNIHPESEITVALKVCQSTPPNVTLPAELP